VIESTLAELPARPVRHFSDLYEADAEAREVARGAAVVGVGPRQPARRAAEDSISP